MKCNVSNVYTNQGKYYCKFKITEHQLVSALNGQFGVRAELTLGIDVVIGEYYGQYILEQDLSYYIPGDSEAKDCFEEFMFEHAFLVKLTPEEADRLSADYDDLNGCKLKKESFQPPPRKKQKVHRFSTFGRAEEERGMNVVLDAYHVKGRRSVLTFINDCQKDLRFVSNPTDDDMKTVNVIFVKTLVNGWPRWFGVTTKRIKKGDELVNNFGPDYGKFLYLKRIRARRQKLVKEDVKAIMKRHGVMESDKKKLRSS